MRLTIEEIQERFDELIELVSRGQVIEVVRDGEVVALIRPPFDRVD